MLFIILLFFVLKFGFQIKNNLIVIFILLIIFVPLSFIQKEAKIEKIIIPISKNELEYFKSDGKNYIFFKGDANGIYRKKDLPINNTVVFDSNNTYIEKIVCTPSYKYKRIETIIFAPVPKVGLECEGLVQYKLYIPKEKLKDLN